MIVERKRLLPSGALAAALFAVACASLTHRAPTAFDQRETAIYRVVAESLYLAKAQGRSIGLDAQLLDTACGPTCPSLEARWGLDSLWWASDDKAVALAMKGALLGKAGKNLEFGPTGVGNARIVVLDPLAVPAATADSAAWRWLQTSTGAVAVLRFSPVGFSRDGTRALVVTHMTCGQLCGHWLAASLTRRNNVWILGDVLLISHER